MPMKHFVCLHWGLLDWNWFPPWDLIGRSNLWNQFVNFHSELQVCTGLDKAYTRTRDVLEIMKFTNWHNIVRSLKLTVWHYFQLMFYVLHLTILNIFTVSKINLQWSCLLPPSLANNLSCKALQWKS